MRIPCDNVKHNILYVNGEKNEFKQKGFGKYPDVQS